MPLQNIPKLPGKISSKLERLLKSPSPEAWALSARLIKGLGSPPEALLRFVEVFSQHYLKDFLDSHHHRATSLSLLDRYPYGILHQKLNQFFYIAQLRAIIEYQHIHLALLVLPNRQNCLDWVELSLSDFQNSLYTPIRVHFEIGKKPLFFDADLRPVSLAGRTKSIGP